MPSCLRSSWPFCSGAPTAWFRFAPSGNGCSTMSAAAVALVRKYWPLLVLILIVVAVGVGSSLVDDLELDETLIEMLIRLVVVIGMYIFIGNSGITSFGHIGFMAIGAYAGAWQTCCPALKPITMPGLPDFVLHTTVPFIPAIIIGGLLAAGVALIVGFFIMRLSGIGASIGPFAFLAIVNVIYSNWTKVTGGTSSIVGIPV